MSAVEEAMETETQTNVETVTRRVTEVLATLVPPIDVTSLFSMLKTARGGEPIPNDAQWLEAESANQFITLLCSCNPLPADSFISALGVLRKRYGQENSFTPAQTIQLLGAAERSQLNQDQRATFADFLLTFVERRSLNFNNTFDRFVNLMRQCPGGASFVLTFCETLSGRGLGNPSRVLEIFNSLLDEAVGGASGDEKVRLRSRMQTWLGRISRTRTPQQYGSRR